MYDYGYTTDAVEVTNSMIGVMGGLFFGIIIFSSIIGLIGIISYAKIFKKAGKPWWASIVPLYNTIVMIEIAKLPMWYIALFFVPGANIYAIFKINIEMAKKFGKSAGFGVGMTLLSLIFVPLLAFSDNKYEEMVNETSNSGNNTFDATQVINSNLNESVSVENINNNVVAAPIENINVMPVENVGITPVSENVTVSDAQPETNDVKPVVESVEPSDVPTVEPTSMENNVNAFNVTPNVVEDINVQPFEEPVETFVAPIENNITEPTSMENNINAFNVTPEIITENVVEPVINSGVQEPAVSNVNTEPVVNNIPQPEVIETITPVDLSVNSSEIDLASNVAEDKKVCKNCGNELPDIVSICPNCGTDNE